MSNGPVHYEMMQVLAGLRENGQFSCTLRYGDTAWNPTTTSQRPLCGPAEITYRQYPDGGIDVEID